MVNDMSESITFDSSRHADSKYVIGFVLGCQEVPQTIHFLFSASRKKSLPAGIGIAFFFWLSRVSKPKRRCQLPAKRKK